jgi:hypothetical protein
MRILPTLCVSRWLVAAAALPSLSAVELLGGGVVQAQQLSPPETSEIQKQPFDPFQSEPLFGWYQGLVGGVKPSNPPADWLSTASDVLNSYSADPGRRNLHLQLTLRTLSGPAPTDSHGAVRNGQ